MTTTYVVLKRVPFGAPDGTDNGDAHGWEEIPGSIEANNSEQACRRVGETMSDDEFVDGPTLIAVPSRNWTSGRHTLKAKTTRRIRST